ncbi:hypothetical protein AB1L30_02240 [Bremerella sp. JC817]|uniref:hypothetical protein n=1 Tax=Bremerella sp. JC817 TaxID=3231756 RepID=UPI0034586F8E
MSEAEGNSPITIHESWRWAAAAVVIVPILYVLSVGPVLGIAFWLRELTGWNFFYGAIYLYYPLLAWGHWSPMEEYIEWWVSDVFQTVGPG